MTDEEKVKAKYPDAYCAHPGTDPNYRDFRIYWAKYPWSACIGRSGFGEAEAWADVAKRLEEN